MHPFIRKALWNGIIVVGGLVILSEAGLIGSITAALLLTAIAYLLGDQIILRQTNNVIATVADAGLAYMFLLALIMYTGWDLNVFEMTMIVAALGVYEFFFHRTLNRQTAE